MMRLSCQVIQAVLIKRRTHTYFCRPSHNAGREVAVQPKYQESLPTPSKRSPFNPSIKRAWLHDQRGRRSTQVSGEPGYTVKEVAFQPKY